MIKDRQIEAISQLFKAGDSAVNQNERLPVFINKIRFENIQADVKSEASAEQKHIPSMVKNDQHWF